LDAERIRAGADPDVREVTVGKQRVPYWQGGRAYEPYAVGYFAAFDPLTWLFLGSFAFGNYGVDESPGTGGDGAGHGLDDDLGAGDAGGSEGGNFDWGGDFGF
jgi:hypothetical protein